MADLTFVSKTDGSGSSSVPTRLCPAGAQVGDLMIACVALRSALPVVGSTGFTTIVAASGHNENDISGPPLVAYKIVTSADVPGVTSYTWGASNFNWSAAIALYRAATPYRRISAVTTHGNTNANGNSSTLSAGSVTAPSASGTLLVCAATNTGLNGEACTYSPGANLNERCDSHQTGDSGSRMQTGIYDMIGTAVVSGANAFPAITQLRSETWARYAFILNYTPVSYLWSDSNSPMVMG